MYSLILRSNDRYAAHQIVDARMRDCNEPVRWGQYDDGTIEIRSHRPIDTGWEEKPVPDTGMKIRFQVDCQVRVHHRDHTGRQQRPVNLDYTRNLDWLERQAPTAGLEIEAVDFDPVHIQINRWQRNKHPAVIRRHNIRLESMYPFTLSASRFRGIARVISAELFDEALASIPTGNPKAFGLGFILFKPTGQ